MSDNVKDRLVEYSKDERMVDLDFFQTVISEVSDRKHLEDNINFVDFYKDADCSFSNSVIMSYTYSEKTISLYENKIIEIYNLIYNDSKDFSSSFLANANILHFLLHELEHANQQKKSQDSNSNFENSLLALCLNTNNRVLRGEDTPVLDNDIEKNFILKDSFRTSNPCERFAYIKSTEEIINIIDGIYEDTGDAYDYFNITLARDLLKGYDECCKIPYPADRYISDYQKVRFSNTSDFLTDRFFKLKKKASKGTFNERITCGLNISKDEYQKVKKIALYK